MRRFSKFFYICLISAHVFCFSFIAQANSSPRLLIKFKPDIQISSGISALKSAGLDVHRFIPEIDLYVTTPALPDQANQAIDVLMKSGVVSFAEKDLPIWTIRETPNDGYFSAQLERFRQLDLESAWNIQKGSANIVVAVVDSGVNLTHPDLKNRIWKNTKEIPGNGVDDDGNGFIDDVNGWDFSAGDNNPEDEHGHGTHVAGIIGAEGNNALGVVGMNWNVSLMPVRYLGKDGSGLTSTGVDSVMYAVQNGARIINASWGSYTSSEALKLAVQYARDHGVLFVAASGNDNSDTDSKPHFPSSYKVSNMISVAATTPNSAKASFSNFGRASTHIGAPGDQILSTLMGNQYGYMSGTSMASPVVAGIAALILAERPNLDVNSLRNAVFNAVERRADLDQKLATDGELNAFIGIKQLSYGFQIWPSHLNIAKNETFQFTAFNASGSLTWESSDPNIARVDQNGVLTALNIGQLTVSVRDSAGIKRTTQYVNIVEPTAETGGGGGCFGKKSKSNSPVETAGGAFSMALPLLTAFGMRMRSRRKTQMK